MSADRTVIVNTLARVVMALADRQLRRAEALLRDLFVQFQGTRGTNPPSLARLRLLAFARGAADLLVRRPDQAERVRAAAETRMVRAMKETTS